MNSDLIQHCLLFHWQNSQESYAGRHECLETALAYIAISGPFIWHSPYKWISSVLVFSQILFFVTEHTDK